MIIWFCHGMVSLITMRFATLCKEGGSESRNIAVGVSEASKLSLLYRRDYCCTHCGQDFVCINGRWVAVTADHIIYFCYGGAANSHNIELVHYACNIERAKNLEIIETHYGSIDPSMLEYIPVLQLRMA